MSKIHQKQELQQTLTPKQILQASLLQLNLTSLEQRILQELEINPALEMVELIDDVQEEEKTSIEDMEEDLGEEDEVESEESNGLVYYCRNCILNIFTNCKISSKCQINFVI